MAVDPDLPLFEAPGRRFIASRPLVRAVGLAGDSRKLILALLGLSLMVLGWGLIDRAVPAATLNGEVDPAATIGWPDRPLDRREAWADAARLVAEPAKVVVAPFVALFARRADVGFRASALLKGVWALVVWSLIGGAIARISAVRLTVGRGVGIGTAVRFALRRTLSLVGAPLTPFLAVAVLAVGCALFGLLYWVPGGVGATIAEVLTFVPLLLGVVLALVLLGVALGWPLMVATVAVEGEDVADALSRSYSYVNQRTIRYLAHLGVAWVLGIGGLIAAVLFARLVLILAGWGVGLGAPSDPGLPPLAAQAHDFWVKVVAWTAHAYLYSYFWSATTAIYLVLRQDVDGTDPHDVFLPEQAADTFAGREAAVDPGQVPTTS